MCVCVRVSVCVCVCVCVCRSSRSWKREGEEERWGWGARDDNRRTSNHHYKSNTCSKYSAEGDLDERGGKETEGERGVGN